ncbi:MAG: hypothetical protein HWE21_00925 [Cytophagia bacterium]|nr:hypothetical protein [Cytophagia bacterium]
MLTKRKVNAFKVYVVMNHYQYGYFKASKESIEFIMKHCDIKSKKTARKHLNDLVSLGFLGYDKWKKVYYIRSYKGLISKNKYRVEFQLSYLDNWRTYLHCSLIGYLALNQRNKLKAIRGKKDGAPYQRLPFSYPVSLQALESILKYSKSNLHIYRSLTESSEFLLITKNVNIETNLTRSYFEYLKHDLKGFFLIGHKVYKRLPNEICPLLSYKKLKGKKLKHIGMDI